MTKWYLSQECKSGITYETNVVTGWKRSKTKQKTDDLK